MILGIDASGTFSQLARLDDAVRGQQSVDAALARDQSVAILQNIVNLEAGR